MACHIALVNPKSPQNVGSVLRAAGCYQADSIRFSGERYARAKAYSTDTKNVHQHIPIHQVNELIDGKADAHLVKVAVELVEGATALPLFEHPKDALYIFGPEDGSLSQSIVDQCQHIVYIPTVGCMNLAATVNVLLYDRLAKSPAMPSGDQLICDSRDTNNRTKVKTI